ncbi:MAG TPA: HWE histidine kinase domain-containing protein [Beijerinckiaceae bacterium]
MRLPRLVLPRISTQLYLLALVAAVVVPLLAFGAFLLTRYAATERARFERDASQIARQVALVLDGELAGLAALLKGLSVSSALEGGDLAQLHVEARRLVDGRDELVVLRDLDTRQLLNTRLPFGTALPAAPPLSPDERAAFVAGRMLVSEVYPSPISGEPRIAVALPVARGGATVHVLAITVPTSRFRDVLLPAVPSGWTVGVGDRNGTYVTRSARHEDVSGKPGIPEYLEKAVGRSGTFTAASYEGVALLAGYYRSDFSGWLSAANVPQQVVEAPLRRSLGLLAVMGTAALALSALFAYLFGRGFADATAGLVRRAAALGEGRPVRPISTRLSEFAVIGEALAAAAGAVEERTRELKTVLSTVPAVILFTYDPEVRRVIRNRFAAELFRLPEGESSAIGGPDLEHVCMLKGGQVLRPDEMPLHRAMRGEDVEEEEYTYAFADGTCRTLLTSATGLRDDKGRIVGAVSVSLDITDRERAEEQRRLLVHELNHRVKNTLATVQSIAVQTLRGSASTAEASEALTDRLMALAKAHDALTRESWEGAALHEIVEAATSPHGGRDRFAVDGPSVWLSPALSLSLALSLHELATNGAKYGALSAAGGSVTIAWEVVDRLGDARLRLRWTEHGGPPVRVPTRRGFGSRLIERSLAAESGGSATIEYRPEGVVCVIEAPIRRREAHAPAVREPSDDGSDPYGARSAGN